MAIFLIVSRKQAANVLSGCILLLEHTSASLLDGFIAGFGAIVKTIENLVPGCLVRAVVAIEIAVMQLMHEIAQLKRKKARQPYFVVTAM